MVWVMTKNTYRSMLPLLWLAAACASHPAVPLTPLEIPSYPADDPRTETGGFVREVRLVEVESDATNYILMAWRTGEILTLGAMTQGPFEGDVKGLGFITEEIRCFSVSYPKTSTKIE